MNNSYTSYNDIYAMYFNFVSLKKIRIKFIFKNEIIVEILDKH